MLHLVAVQKAFVAGVASLAMGARNCSMSWEKIVKGLGHSHGAYRGATCSLLCLLTLFLAVRALSTEFPRM